MFDSVSEAQNSAPQEILNPNNCENSLEIRYMALKKILIKGIQLLVVSLGKSDTKQRLRAQQIG